MECFAKENGPVFHGAVFGSRGAEQGGHGLFQVFRGCDPTGQNTPASEGGNVKNPPFFYQEIAQPQELTQFPVQFVGSTA